MSRAPNFTPEDMRDLVCMAMRGDFQECSQWANDHIRTGIDVFVMLKGLSYLIAQARSLEFPSVRSWRIEGGDAMEPQKLAAAQMVTAALNKDEETSDALILACMSHPQAHIERTIATLLAAVAVIYIRDMKEGW